MTVLCNHEDLRSDPTHTHYTHTSIYTQAHAHTSHTQSGAGQGKGTKVTEDNCGLCGCECVGGSLEDASSSLQPEDGRYSGHWR